MAAQCPQGFTDVEFPTPLIAQMATLDLAVWDTAEGVYKLTPAGKDFLHRLATGLPAAPSEEQA